MAFMKLRSNHICIFILLCLAGVGYSQSKQLFLDNPLAKSNSNVTEKAKFLTTGDNIKRFCTADFDSSVFLADSSFLINLFPDARFEATVHKVEAGDKDIKDLWAGTLAGFPLSDVEIFYHGTCISGRINTGKALYTFISLDKDAVLIKEIDLSKKVRM
jgi:hypothetical protein